jgi:hypothetical protein
LPSSQDPHPRVSSESFESRRITIVPARPLVSHPARVVRIARPRVARAAFKSTHLTRNFASPSARATPRARRATRGRARASIGVLARARAIARAIARRRRGVRRARETAAGTTRAHTDHRATLPRATGDASTRDARGRRARRRGSIARAGRGADELRRTRPTTTTTRDA